MINNESIEIFSVGISEEIKNLQLVSANLDVENPPDMLEFLVNSVLQKSFHNVLVNIHKEIERRNKEIEKTN